MDSDRTKKEKVVEQLVQGYEFATQLRLLISKPFDDHRRHDPTRIPCGSVSGSGSAEELLAKILRSFDKTILTLHSLEPVNVPPSSSAAAVEGSWNTSCDDSAMPEFNIRRCEDSDDSRKRIGPNKGKRGCYKRKMKSQIRIVESATLEDAHSWRKYGQKEILNAKYPRNYFRCTHKYTQGCKARRQVQKLDERPTIFQITYIGNHTCVNPMGENHSTKIDPADSVITMDSKNGTCENMKEEDHDDHHDLSLVWNDFMAFEELERMYYCSGETGSRGLDMESLLLGTHNFPFLDDFGLSF